MQIGGIHHVTAITGHAPENVRFYTQVLGMRLVKKTVNQDDVSAYHLFYADGLGSPGTDLTFFDWPQVVKNQNGAGSIARVTLRVPSLEALTWWEQRLTAAGVTHGGIVETAGYSQIRFTDPEGLEMALVNDGGAPGGTPWDRSPVMPSMGIKGLHSVTLLTHELEPVAQVLTGVLGFHQNNDFSVGDDRVVVFSAGAGGPGAEVLVEVRPGMPYTRQGRGGIHHVAFRTPNEAEQLEWRSRIAGAGLNVTQVIDRFYFKSIYFRIPEGILFEIATDGPGFHADEDIDHLGERLALPPFLEHRRETIESQLKPLEV